MQKQTADYWLCQLGGWTGLVLIEWSNYTFFIYGKFRWEFLLQFGISALIGILVTHGYRILLHKSRYFQKKHGHTWLFALTSTIILSVLITIIGLLVFIPFGPPDSLSEVRAIELIGQVYNWSRYIGVWIIIYFLYHLLQRKHAMEQEKLLMETQAKNAEPELIKTQSNANFLFNALNSIKALVSINAEVSCEAIVKLSGLLRFTLQYNKEQEIPLAEELFEVTKYMDLKKLHFGDRLNLSYDITRDFSFCCNTYGFVANPFRKCRKARNRSVIKARRD